MYYFQRRLFTLAIFSAFTIAITCRIKWNYDSKVRYTETLRYKPTPKAVSFGRLSKRNTLPRFIATGDGRIFFYKNPSRKWLDPIECCSIESAAMHNPTRSIQLFVSEESLSTYQSDHCFSVLRSYKNVQIVRLNMSKYFASSPLQSWYTLTPSPPREHHLSAFLRLVEAYRHGGLFLENSCITLRTYSKKVHWNFFALADPDGMSLTSSAFHTERSSPLIAKIIEEVLLKYQPNVDIKLYTSKLVSSVVSNCFQKNSFSKKPQCKEIGFVPYDHFFPIPASMSTAYKRKPSDNSMALINGSYAACVSFEPDVDMKTYSLLSLLASVNCPSAYALYRAL